MFSFVFVVHVFCSLVICVLALSNCIGFCALFLLYRIIVVLCGL